jgi:DNA-binding beta-propeller fold protein YncE
MIARKRAATVALLMLALTQNALAQANPTPLAIETVAGSGQAGDLGGTGGAALRMAVDQPFGVECGPDGALYITSVGAHRVLRLDLKTRELTSVAGSGKSGHSGDGGPATEALLNEPYEVRFDADGHYMYFVEMKNHLVRRVDLHTGIISTVGGDPKGGYAGDGGPASQALFRQPHSIALDDRGNLYVADIGNHRIRRIDTQTGTIASIAGNGRKQLPPDGSQALGQPILGPRALEVVGRTLWIALREGNSIWRLDLDSGVIRRVAGTGKSGYTGDGGPPLEATFAGPKGIAATSEGLVYVADTENQAVRLVDTNADRIDTVGGRGPKARGFAGKIGPALEAKFDRPHGICVGPDGTVYLGDTNNHRVRRLHPSP